MVVPETKHPLGSERVAFEWLGESTMYMGKSEMTDFWNSYFGDGVVVPESKHPRGSERVALEWLGESIMYMSKSEMTDFWNS